MKKYAKCFNYFRVVYQKQLQKDVDIGFHAGGGPYVLFIFQI